MNRDFPGGMTRATAATRAGGLSEATRIIGEALGLRARTGPEAMTPWPENVAVFKRRAASGPARVDEAALTAKRTPPVWTPREEPSASGRRAGRGLGESVRALKEGRHALWPGLVGNSLDTNGPAIPEGARFESRRFTCAEGAREYRLYAPSAAAGAPRGLILMLHGCKQNPEDFALGTGMNDHAEAEGLVLVYPRQAACENASSCWNWFRSSDQARDRGEPAILAGMVGAVAAEFGVPADRCFVAGLSAGGAMAAVLSEVYPEVFAAAGIHSGVPTGAASDLLSAFAAMRGEAAPARPAAIGRRIVFHGIADRTVHPANAGRLLPEEIQAAKRTVGRTAGGRDYQRMMVSDADGQPRNELWLVEGGDHAWFGGEAEGSFTDPAGPDASAEMVRFFLGRN
jgi:poly(hydroxyalkanoate) depolymerase family esterase